MVVEIEGAANGGGQPGGDATTVIGHHHGGWVTRRGDYVVNQFARLHKGNIVSGR